MVERSGFVDASAPTGTLKFTMLDTERKTFTARTTAKSGNDVTIEYSNAAVGSNEYVSAVIKKADGAVTGYAKLAESTSAAGSAAFTLPDTFNAQTDTVYVFSEQANGDLYTDFASELAEISLKVDAAVTPATAGFDQYAPADIVLTKSDGTYALIAIKNGETTLTKGTDYTMEGDTVTIKKEYLKTIAVGTATLTFDYGMTTNPTAAVTVTDSTPTRNITVTQPVSGGSVEVNPASGKAGDTTTVTAPQTGDHTQMMLWYILLTISGTALFGGLYLRKRKYS